MEAVRTNIVTDGSTEENIKEVRTHRVGSITLGSALVAFGILFLVHLFVPVLTYEMIFHAWPCIFILLGIEILLANRKKNVEFIYDGKAVFLTITLTLFAMLMAVIDVIINNAVTWYINF